MLTCDRCLSVGDNMVPYQETRVPRSSWREGSDGKWSELQGPFKQVESTVYICCGVTLADWKLEKELLENS